LLRDPARQARFRRAGRLTVESRYSFEVRMKKLGALYDALLEQA
jgi:hypothetical protein